MSHQTEVDQMAARTIAVNANDPTELVEFLAMLGLLGDGADADAKIRGLRKVQRMEGLT